MNCRGRRLRKEKSWLGCFPARQSRNRIGARAVPARSELRGFGSHRTKPRVRASSLPLRPGDRSRSENLRVLRRFCVTVIQRQSVVGAPFSLRAQDAGSTSRLRLLRLVHEACEISRPDVASQSSMAREGFRHIRQVVKQSAGVCRKQRLIRFPSRAGQQFAHGHHCAR